MNYYPLRPDDITRTVSGTGKQLFVIDPFDHPPVPAIVGSLAGFEYRLPALNRLAPVVHIRALTATDFSLPGEYADRGMRTPSLQGYADWLIYTRDPTGKELMRYMPLSAFCTGKATEIRTRYLLNHWIDPLQSHLLCTMDNENYAPVLEFTYGHV